MNSRHKLRELAMTSLYQHFLLQKGYQGVCVRQQ